VLPRCPITRRPARRKVQDVGAGFLRDMWRLMAGVDAARFFPAGGSIGLYESDCGLMFFEPRPAGDAEFYTKLFERFDTHRFMRKHARSRAEYIEAARHVPRGARVLDVGCATGEFRHHLPHATFCGLDPFAPPDADASVVRETLEQHLQRNAGGYDVVTAFQVIEHVAEPREFAEGLAKLLKPGGLLILGVPLHPSPLTEIPNYLINAPPHHMTWWSKDALAALSDALGLEPLAISALPASPQNGQTLWIQRLSLRRTDPPPNDAYFGNRVSWLLSPVLAYWLSQIAMRIKMLPRNAAPTAVMLVARKPG
jgi:SAM-dependent methyltransferase